MLPAFNLTNKQFKNLFWPKSTEGFPGPPLEPTGVPSAFGTPLNPSLYCVLVQIYCAWEKEKEREREREREGETVLTEYKRWSPSFPSLYSNQPICEYEKPLSSRSSSIPELWALTSNILSLHLGHHGVNNLNVCYPLMNPGIKWVADVTL